MKPELNQAVREFLYRGEDMTRIRLVKAVRDINPEKIGLKMAVTTVDDAIENEELFRCRECKTYITLERMFYCESCLEEFSRKHTNIAKYKILKAKEFIGELSPNEHTRLNDLQIHLTERLEIAGFEMEEMEPMPPGESLGDKDWNHTKMSVSNVEILHSAYPGDSVKYP